jgi:hypothetical protein
MGRRSLLHFRRKLYSCTFRRPRQAGTAERRQRDDTNFLFLTVRQYLAFVLVVAEIIAVLHSGEALETKISY